MVFISQATALVLFRPGPPKENVWGQLEQDFTNYRPDTLPVTGLATQWSCVRSPSTALSVGWCWDAQRPAGDHVRAGIPFRYVTSYQANSAFYPLWVGKWVPAEVRWCPMAGSKGRTATAHSISERTCEWQVKLWSLQHVPSWALWWWLSSLSAIQLYALSTNNTKALKWTCNL